tara:strand:- start:96 stop:809 length:714 start_codon:yes stop_codon:yes gene_type:complete
MSSQKKSVLLPGSFFEKNSQKKLDYLKTKNLYTVYVFDHTANPVDDKLAMYEIKRSISLLESYEDRNFNIGTAVLNINKRRLDNLITEYINPFLDIENFKLGLGVGDYKYQKNLPNYSNNIEEIISYLLENFEISKESKNIFLGGNSNQNIKIMKKYSVGINQWLGSINELYKTRDIYKKIDRPMGSISLCVNKDLYLKNKIIFDDIESIFIIEEGSSENFYSQVDIFLNENFKMIE